MFQEDTIPILLTIPDIIPIQSTILIHSIPNILIIHSILNIPIILRNLGGKMKSLVTQVTEALDRVPQIRHTVTGYQQGGSNLYLINVQCNPRRVLYTSIEKLLQSDALVGAPMKKHKATLVYAHRYASNGGFNVEVVDVKVNVVGEDYVKNWNEMLTYAQEIDEVRIKRMQRRNKSI
ncbi:MAG: hypothetical protein AABX72_03940 [Nanoarchaeota archaeon]